MYGQKSKPRLCEGRCILLAQVTCHAHGFVQGQRRIIISTADRARQSTCTQASRSGVYTKLWSAAAAANGVGPLMATVVFARHRQRVDAALAGGEETWRCPSVWSGTLRFESALSEPHLQTKRYRVCTCRYTIYGRVQKHLSVVLTIVSSGRGRSRRAEAEVLGHPSLPHAQRRASQIVIYVGMALSLLPAITLQFFDDTKFLGAESDAIMSAVPSAGAAMIVLHTAS